jgi:predicted phosphodiesterase
MTTGILSDAHGNVEALELALRVLDRWSVSRVFFLGDAVGYLPGAGVADLLVRGPTACVRGNHEAMLFEPELRRGRDDAYRLEETAAAMSASTRDAVDAWPPFRWENVEGLPSLMVHGSPLDHTFGYVYPDTDLTPLVTDEVQGVTVFMGNTHRPFVRRWGTTTFVNVGSCGLPRDVGGLGSACVVDDDGEVHIIRFDIREATRQALRRTGPVHESVTASLTREAADHVGELVTI